MSPTIDGLLLVDKPCGPTSHDVVDLLRRASGQRRIGHTGTLDPLASGLLLVVLGAATRLARFLPHSPKLYIGSLELGWTSDTDDVSGTAIARVTGSLPELPAVQSAAGGLVGRSLQVPPAYSARKVGGKRLYRSAMRGIKVDAPPAPVDVTQFAIGPGDRQGRFSFHVEVSAGTYVRSLIRDLGAQLGCGAVLATLRRTRIGPLEIDQARQPDALTTAATIFERVVPLDDLPLALPSVIACGPDDVRRFRAGLPVQVATPGTDEACAVRSPKGELLGVGGWGDGGIHPRLVLPARASDLTPAVGLDD